MSRLTPPEVQDSIAPNVVPLLDVMFLLMIFLMLGSDMSVRETAEVELARAEMAEEPRPERPGRFATLNVVHAEEPTCDAHDDGRPCRDASHWHYDMLGVGFGAAALAERLTLVAADDMEPAVPGTRQLSNVTLTIRCDRSAPYGLVQDAFVSCAEVGIHRTEVAAGRPPEPR